MDEFKKTIKKFHTKSKNKHILKSHSTGILRENVDLIRYGSEKLKVNTCFGIASNICNDTIARTKNSILKIQVHAMPSWKCVLTFGRYNIVHVLLCVHFNIQQIKYICSLHFVLHVVAVACTWNSNYIVCYSLNFFFMSISESEY